MPAVVGPFANKLIEHIEGLTAVATKGRAEELDATTMRAMADVRQKRDEMKKALSAWLTADPLPVRSWALSLELAGTAPHGQVVLEHPGEISSAFLVDATRDVGWSRPRRIGDLVQGMTVQVGFKKAFLRSSLQPDIAALDELVIAAAEIGPDSAEIHLRRRLDQPRDSYVLAADPNDDGSMGVRVTRFEQKGEDSAPYLSEGDDKARILELVSVVRREGRSLLGHKKRLLSLQIDGHDVFEQGLVATLFSRVAARMRPLAVEIERRSPNRAELSLKVEKPDGRREEIYLKKADLAALVHPLPAELHSIFHGLGVFGDAEGAARSASSSSSASVHPPAPSAATRGPGASMMAHLSNGVRIVYSNELPTAVAHTVRWVIPAFLSAGTTSLRCRSIHSFSMSALRRTTVTWLRVVAAAAAACARAGVGDAAETTTVRTVTASSDEVSCFTRYLRVGCWGADESRGPLCTRRKAGDASA